MTVHTTTVTPVGTPGLFGSGPHRIECTCGERVTYDGAQFTALEAERHRAWHRKVGR